MSDPWKSKLRFAARAWYYFRLGYSTYLTFLLGYVSTLITVYYLAIKNIPDLLNVFPHFVPFALLATVTGVPLSIGIGWVHLKRSPAYSSELEVSIESNPWYYKVPPGYNREAWNPVFLELLVQMKKMLQSQGLLNSEEESRIEVLERKLRLLNEGGFVGRPRVKM